MPRAKGVREHLTSFRRRGRDESRQQVRLGQNLRHLSSNIMGYEKYGKSVYGTTL